MARKRIDVKDITLSKLLKKGGRSGARKDFFTLLKRAALPAGK